MAEANEEGKAYFRAGQYVEAAEYFTRALAVKEDAQVRLLEYQATVMVALAGKIFCRCLAIDLQLIVTSENTRRLYQMPRFLHPSRSYTSFSHQPPPPRPPHS